MEDPLDVLSPEELSADPELYELYREHWPSIRSRFKLSRKGRQDVYCFRVQEGTREEFIENFFLVFNNTPFSFRCNCSFSVALESVETGELRFYHASENFFLFESSFLITGRKSLQKLLKAFSKKIIREHYTLSLRKNSKWIFRRLLTHDIYVVKTQKPSKNW